MIGFFGWIYIIESSQLTDTIISLFKIHPNGTGLIR